MSGNGHEDEIEVVGEENLNLEQMLKRIIALEAQVKKLLQAAPPACKHTCPQTPKPPPEKHHTYATVANNSITIRFHLLVKYRRLSLYSFKSIKFNRVRVFEVLLL